jgi:hypothetical protein
MRHYHRTHISSDAALKIADEFFPTIGLAKTSSLARSRAFSGTLGTMTLKIRPDGGHYTFIEVDTDQTGESRLDRNVKRYFVKVRKTEEPARTLEAAY